MNKEVWTYYGRHAWRDAQLSFFECVSLRPGHLDAWRGLLLSTLRLGEHGLAFSLIRSIQSLFVLDASDARRLSNIAHRLDQTLEAHDDLLEMDSDMEAHLCQRAEFFIRKSRGLSALYVTETLVEQCPEVPYYRILAARAHDLVGNEDAAVTFFGEALYLASQIENAQALYVEVALQRLTFLCELEREEDCVRSIAALSASGYVLTHEQSEALEHIKQEVALW